MPLMMSRNRASLPSEYASLPSLGAPTVGGATRGNPATPSADAAEGIVHVVDGDPATRAALVWLIQSVGLTVEASAAATEFLRRFDGARAACCLFDARLPDMNGLELLECLKARGDGVPVILLAAQADVATAVRALKSGACDFLEKPVEHQPLLERVQFAVRQDRQRRAREVRWRIAMSRLARLSEKEREVLDLFAAGEPNKLIAARLGISERAVEMRRAGVMRKLEAASLAEALETLITVRLAEELRAAP